MIKHVDYIMDRLPNFLIIGAAKSGTTTLANYLSSHPNVYIPAEKETHFFNNDELFITGVDGYVKRFFKNANQFDARGEATPAYLRQYERVIPRIKTIFDIDRLKLIVILRDPVERAWSHYMHMRRNRWENLSFDDAVGVENERMEMEPNGWYGYAKDGLYFKQLSAWKNAFPNAEFLVLTLDELKSDPGKLLRKVYKFINVDSSVYFDKQDIRNRASSPRSEIIMDGLSGNFFGGGIIKRITPNNLRRKVVGRLRKINLKSLADDDREVMSVEMRQKLVRLYAEDLALLEESFGVDVSRWETKEQGDISRS